MTLGDLLSEKIAKHLFEKLGSNPTPCQRIEFKGGTYPDAEIGQGGMDRACFARVVRIAIDRAMKDLKP